MKTKKLKIFHSSFFIATLFSIILNQISHSYASTPSVGTLVSWTDDTFFDTYSSGSGVTTTDLPDTNSLTWQMFYSYAPLRLSVDTNRLGVNTWRSGSNTWKWRVAISSADDTIGSWGTETDFATGSASYTAGGVTQNAITTQVNIPSNRYFLIGIYNGPYYKSYKQLNANRTAQISGVNYFTSISNIYHAAHGSGVLSGIPSAIGGNSSSFTTYANYSLVSTIKFKATGTPAAPDTTAPTFTSSSSFSAAENISTSTNAATIKVSESATVTISSGADAARFNIVISDSITAFIRFKVSPDFEAPTDVGANNIYEITLTATDAASNAGTQSITITVTDVVDTSSFNSLTLSGAATYRQVVTITANVSVTSRVTFRAKNIIISGCKNKITSGSSPNITATCSWKPSTRGAVVITATAVPTGAGISGATATPVSVVVGNRSGARS